MSKTVHGFVSDYDYVHDAQLLGMSKQEWKKHYVGYDSHIKSAHQYDLWKLDRLKEVLESSISNVNKLYDMDSDFDERYKYRLKAIKLTEERIKMASI
jgi:hypothetical protein